MNEAPTNLTLSYNIISENQAIGTTVGNFITTDPDDPNKLNPYTYSLVAGTGSTDNNLFTIQNNRLKTNAIFDFETKNSYSIRVKTTDQSGLSFEKTFTININNLTEPVVKIPINDILVQQNAANTNLNLLNHFDDPSTTGKVAKFELYNTSLAGGNINVLLFDQLQTGALLTVNNFLNYVNDGDYTNTFIHRSIPGFVVQGGGFKVTGTPTSPFYSVSTVPSDPAVQNEFNSQRSNVRGTIAMAKLGDNPNSATNQWFFNLDNNASNLDSQNGGFTVFGQVLSQADLAVIDAIATVPIYRFQQPFDSIPLTINTVSQLDSPDDFVRFRSITVASLNELTFSVVSNSNPNLVNASISSNQLVLDYLDNQTGSAELRIRGRSLLGYTVEDSFIVTVNSNNQNPTNLTLSNSNINENKAIDTVIGNLITTDPNPGNTFTYSLVTGTGSTDNVFFTISGNQLKTKAVFDFETKNSYSIRVKTTDQGGLSFEKVLTITINNLTTNLITGTNANENFIATNETDTIQAVAGNDNISTSITNWTSGDIFDGGDGSDTFILTGGNITQILSLNLNNTNQFISLSNPILNSVILNNFENINLDTFTGNVTIVGSNIPNQLTGGTGNNTLNGGAGNDTMIGGSANDILRGETGNDALAGGEGNDAISGGDGNDRIRGDAGNDTIDGGNGIDTIIDSGDFSFVLTNTSLTGNGTDNLVRIEQAEIKGGIGNNTINASAFTLGSVILNGGSGNDTTMGGISNDTIRGELGNDELNGGAGNDTISGGDGNDRISGGAGNDTIDGGNGTDTITETGDFFFILTNTSLSGNGTDSLIRIEQGELTGGIGNNTLNASAFTLGSVILNGGSGNDTIMGGTGNDTMRGEVGNDALAGGDGNDAISGGDGNDRIRGNAGNDTIDGGNGIDTFAESGDFSFVLTNTSLTGNGTDNLIRIEQVELTGGVGNNTINASAFTLGFVNLNGGAGNDTLTGGSSNDILTGGTGSDRMTFNGSNQGIDSITDFNVIDDTIAVSAAGFGGGLVANATITAAQFFKGSTATTVSQRFIYDNTTGGLFFDADGNGLTAKTQIATLSTGLLMTNNDIFVI